MSLSTVTRPVSKTSKLLPHLQQVVAARVDGALRDSAAGALGGVGHRLLPAVVLEVLDALISGEIVVEDSPLPGVGANLSLFRALLTATP